MKRIIAGLAVAALAFAAACSESQVTAVDDAALAQTASARTIWYTGNGFDFDGSTYNLKDERCGLTGQNDADDGGTGQFANWNGEGMPYEAGQGYLLWVLTLNATPTDGVRLHLPDDTVNMIQVGGTWKFASEYYSYASLVGLPVTATFNDAGLRIRGTVNLVVSHGCAPFEGDGAWCSPGYWRNARDGAWSLIGNTFDPALTAAQVKALLFGETVEVDPQYTPTGTQPSNISLITILNDPPTYSGPAIGTFRGWSANAFNLTGAWLTDQIPGYDFDPDRVGQEDACPIDNHGNFK
jgi:hypothetical protein